MKKPLTISNLIRLLEKQLEDDPNAIVQFEDNYKFWNIEIVPIRYSSDGISIVTVRKTTLVYSSI